MFKAVHMLKLSLSSSNIRSEFKVCDGKGYLQMTSWGKAEKNKASTWASTWVDKHYISSKYYKFG